MKKTSTIVLIILVLLLSACSERFTSRVETLSSGWKMQPQEKLNEVEEEKISLSDFGTDAWYDAIVPGTVLGSMATNKVIEDPYFGINMQSVDPEQFKQPWWFRTTFSLTAEDLKKIVSLRFNGINYRADLWVNGKLVADKNEFAGTYRMFTFNINDFVKVGENSIALKMIQHADGEYSIGFVDWNPLPRDRNLGIFREVFLEINDGVKIRSPFVYSKVNKETLKDADLFFQTELVNSTHDNIKGTLRVNYELGVIEKKVEVKAGETLFCNFTPEEFPELSVKDVSLWWPNGMGVANLYSLTTEFISGKKIIDRV